MCYYEIVKGREPMGFPMVKPNEALQQTRKPAGHTQRITHGRRGRICAGAFRRTARTRSTRAGIYARLLAERVARYDWLRLRRRASHHRGIRETGRRTSAPVLRGERRQAVGVLQRTSGEQPRR